MKDQWLMYMVYGMSGLILIAYMPTFSLHLEQWDQWFTLFIFVLFLAVVQKFPMPIGKGNVMLDLPLIYLFYLIFGFIEVTVFVCFTLIVTDLFQRRPLRTAFYNASTYVLSLWGATVTVSVMGVQPFEGFWHGIVHVCVFMLLFVLINNFFIDLLLWLRPDPYPWRQWWHKGVLEGGVFAFHLTYGALFHLFVAQERSGDVFSYTYFLIPIVALAIISHIIAKLSEEKRKLNVLLAASSQMNESIEQGEVLDGMKEAVTMVMSYTYGMIYMKNGEKFHLARYFGYEVEQRKGYYQQIGEQIVANVLQKQKPVFHSHYTYSSSIIAVPVVLDKVTIGVIVIVKERTNSFFKADQTILQTLANQAAIAIKNSWLAQEKERSVVIEERNRMAREIHDSIAQSIAAITMRTELCLKNLYDQPQQVEETLRKNIQHLRQCLQDVRHSIYSLRPSPTDGLRLEEAIDKKVKEFEHTTQVATTLDVVGSPYRIEDQVKKYIFELVGEALQNVHKHAQAEQVNVKLYFQENELTVTVCDDGQGFSLSEIIMNKEERKHFGLKQMNDLSKALNAAFHIDSLPGEGTEIRLTIPCHMSERRGAGDDFYRIS